ncbi:hypothetical protein PanWU01x14_255840 [Parasponia andersonii]|uniref:Uncharacterized protein n=1 Tax=Parasponia andersonii TaxID=3476 RepID=A0A2P5BAI7_PARAD|nr:hypothetical protein PanWU01x14_255840 [Parasponia andersonii]
MGLGKEGMGVWRVPKAHVIKGDLINGKFTEDQIKEILIWFMHASKQVSLAAEREEVEVHALQSFN